MKLREYRYRLLSHILWGNKKQHYKNKWKAAKLKKNKKLYEKLSKMLYSKNTTFEESNCNNDTFIPIIKKIEEDLNSKNIVYIFQHQMFDCTGTECFNGGAERYVQDLADIINRYKLQAVLVQYGDYKKGLWKKKVNNLIVYGLPVKFTDYEKAIRYFKNYRFVIYSGMTDIWGAKLHPNILISHGVTWDHHLSDVNPQSILHILDDVDQLVSVDVNTISWLRTTYSKTIHDKNYKMTYIPNYVDTSIYIPKKRKDNDKIYVTFPRRAAPERGYWLVSSVLPFILDKYPNIIFNFVGYAHGEKIRNDIDRLEKLYPNQITHCVCSPDEMPEIYQNSDISLIPTLYCEGTSLSCIEAQACGNVVISTNIGGLPNLIIDGYNGLLINPDKTDLMKALDKVLSSPQLRANLSNNALNVAKYFDKSYWKQKWNDIIEENIQTSSSIRDSKSFIKLLESKEETFIINTSTWDYYALLQQRPNHIFNTLVERKYSCIFCSNNVFAHPKENLYIIPWHWLKDVLSSGINKILDVPLNYPYHYLGEIDKYIDKNTLIFYELIDDFDLLENELVIKQAKEMFIKLTKRENTYILTSADKLYQVALSLGADPQKTIISKNAVNINDFNIDSKQPIPTIMQKILKKNKPIIGYYGALTSTWFNFDLLIKLIENNADMEFILIGDKCVDKNIEKSKEYFKKLEKFNNFTYIPPVPYNDIPLYAKCWDVATIPFKINDITLGCSPVKLFEYMAMELPIVATPMPECQLYKSVFIASDAKEFEKQIKAAIEAKSDKKYQQILNKEASENTWDARVDDMVKIIEEHYGK